MNVVAAPYSEQNLRSFALGDRQGHCIPAIRAHNHPLQPESGARSFVLVCNVVKHAKAFILGRAASREVFMSQDASTWKLMMLVLDPGDRVFFRALEDLNQDPRRDQLLLHVDFEGYSSYSAAVLGHHLRSPLLQCERVPNIKPELRYHPGPYPPPVMSGGSDECWFVERVLDFKRTGPWRRYLVRWAGFPPADDLWITRAEMKDVQALDAFGVPDKESEI